MDTEVTFCIDSETKAQMEAICDHIGMTTSDAFNIFAKAFVRAKGLPFTVNLRTPLAQIPREQPQGCCQEGPPRHYQGLRKTHE